MTMVRDIPRELGALSAYSDDFTVIVSNHRHNDLVGEAIKENKTVMEAKINRESSVVLRLGTRRSKPMSSKTISIVGAWIDGPVKLLRVWFVPDLQKEKNRGEITSRMTTFS